ncbi:MAG: GNAT family N-acetyltransferase, partial [Anaerolineaceae bacterium]|nr:GNAT family N-acetyltransferase [Anaerolineaceae bacterium]
ATPAMSLELARVPASLSAPAGLEISVVKDIPGLQTWCSTFVGGYGIPEEFAEPLYALFEGIGLGFPLRHYLGILDGEPVGTALLNLAGGVAGIYCVATLDHMRGRGIGTALTLAPLEEARKLCFQYGVLQSSGMGYNLYQRLGFERVCDLEHYFWKG